MKTKMFLLLVVIGLMSSCQKKLEIIPDKTLYEVSFAPNLYGQVVPWNSKKNDSKGFNDFVHKYLNHVIRLKTSTGTFIIDVPIVTPSLSGNYSYSLPVGDYTAEVLAVTETVFTGNGTYTPFVHAGPNTVNRASIETASPVAFSITGALGSPVVLNCITRYMALQFDLQGTDYVTAGVPRPNYVTSFNSGFNTAHAVAGQEQATFAQLQALTGTRNVILAMPSPVSFTETNGFWYDAVANIYYLYTSETLPAYLCFDLVGGTGSSMPVIWLKNSYPSRTWIANTTMRVSYTFGSFQVNQLDWFGTIITK
jgi:hypothetical protein